MTRAVSRYVGGLEWDPVYVGRPCVQSKALATMEMIWHMTQWRRRQGMTAIYQIGDTEVNDPQRQTTPEHRWRYLSSRDATYVRAKVVALSGERDTSARPALILKSTTDATGTTFARVARSADPGSASTTEIDFSMMSQHTADVEVTPDSTEILELEQASTTDTVRILSATLIETPNADIISTDASWISPNTYAAGTDIIKDDWQSIPTAVQGLRRYHKKILLSNAKHVSTNSATFVDILSKTSTGVPWNVFPSVVLPERTNVPVEVAVLASASGANTGEARFSFSGGDVDITGIDAALGWYTTTDSSKVTKGSDTVSIKIRDTAGTLNVYGWAIIETVEAA